VKNAHEITNVSEITWPTPQLFDYLVNRIGYLSE
jgi:hypothetical protein